MPGSIRFDGVSAAEELYKASLFAASGPATYMAWIRPYTNPTGGNYHNWFGQGNTGTNACVLGLLGSNVNLGTQDTDNTIEAVRLSQWNHWTVVRPSTTTVVVYKNGKKIGATLTPGHADSTNFIIGKYITGDSTTGADADIAAVKCWGRALSPTEILRETHQYVPVAKGGLLAFYPLFDATTPGRDLSGNNKGMTLGGTIAIAAGPNIPWDAPRFSSGPIATFAAEPAAAPPGGIASPLIGTRLVNNSMLVGGRLIG